MNHTSTLCNSPPTGRLSPHPPNDRIRKIFPWLQDERKEEVIRECLRGVPILSTSPSLQSSELGHSLSPWTTITTTAPTIPKATEDYQCCWIDAWKLRELALQPGGLLSPSLRKRAWPLLLASHELLARNSTSLQPPPPPPTTTTLHLECNNSTMNIPQADSSKTSSTTSTTSDKMTVDPRKDCFEIDVTEAEEDDDDDDDDDQFVDTIHDTSDACDEESTASVTEMLWKQLQLEVSQTHWNVYEHWLSSRKQLDHLHTISDPVHNSRPPVEHSPPIRDSPKQVTFAPMSKVHSHGGVTSAVLPDETVPSPAAVSLESCRGVNDDDDDEGIVNHNQHEVVETAWGDAERTSGNESMKKNTEEKSKHSHSTGLGAGTDPELSQSAYRNSRKVLYNLLFSLLCNPTAGIMGYEYGAGIVDLTAVIMINLESPSLANLVMQRLMMVHLRDALLTEAQRMVPSHNKFHSTNFRLLALLRRLDPRVARRLQHLTPLPRSWITGWMASHILDIRIISRFFDVLLVGHPLTIYYLTVSMLTIQRKRILRSIPVASSLSWMDIISVVLTIDNIEPIIVQAMNHMRRFPPRRFSRLLSQNDLAVPVLPSWCTKAWIPTEYTLMKFLRRREQTPLICPDDHEHLRPRKYRLSQIATGHRLVRPAPRSTASPWVWWCLTMIAILRVLLDPQVMKIIDGHPLTPPNPIEQPPHWKLAWWRPKKLQNHQPRRRSDSIVLPSQLRPTSPVAASARKAIPINTWWFPWYSSRIPCLDDKGNCTVSSNKGTTPQRMDRWLASSLSPSSRSNHMVSRHIQTPHRWLQSVWKQFQKVWRWINTRVKHVVTHRKRPRPQQQPPPQRSSTTQSQRIRLVPIRSS